MLRIHIFLIFAASINYNYFMGRKDFNESDLVKIRTRKRASGMRAVFLEYCVNGKQKQEYLGLCLEPEEYKDKKSMTHNKDVMRIANNVKAKKTLELLETKTGLNLKRGNTKMLLSDFIVSFRAEKEKTSRGKGYVVSIDNVRKHLEQYRGNKIRMVDIDKDFCTGFVEYLKTATGRIVGAPLSHATQTMYFTIFCTMLKQAVQDGVISKSPIDMMKRSEKLKTYDTERVYLDLSEVKQLANTECDFDIIKKAFMFSCFCGLRISDIRKLEWKDIEVVTDRYGNKNYRLSVIMQKTQRKISYTLSNEALKWLPEKGDSNLVFNGLFLSPSLNKYVKKWAEAAGITKNVSFHTARHTFATMMLTLGADLYTTSKLLGHTNIATTQIYAKIIDKKKDEAMGLIDKFFG